MKREIRRKVMLALTLDSSETVMFNQGGMHKVEIPSSYVAFEEPYILEVSIQLEKNHQRRHDFITQEAANHIRRRDENQVEDDEEE